MSAEQLSENEFSRVIATEALAKGPITLKVTATVAERQALARRFDLLECRSLEARVRLRLRSKGMVVSFTADLTAIVAQPCVVSLEPVVNEIRESLDLLFTLQAEETDAAELVIDPEGPDPAEPIGPEGLDIGEILAQQLAIALDPYPRLASTQPLTETAELKGPDDDEPRSPFAVLKVLKGSA